MLITLPEATRWRDNAVALARELGYDNTVLDKIVTDVPLHMYDINPLGKPLLYGFAQYVDPVHIGILQENLSTVEEERTTALRLFLGFMGVDHSERGRIIGVFENIPPDDFYEIFNQSGMDHELIGHMYHFLKGEEHGERVAVDTQIKFAEARKHLQYWPEVLEIMPTIMKKWKSLDDLD